MNNRVAKIVLAPIIMILGIILLLKDFLLKPKNLDKTKDKDVELKNEISDLVEESKREESLANSLENKPSGNNPNWDV